MHDTLPEEPHEAVPRDHNGIYSALMSGLGHDEQDGLERLMHDNEERLRETGDGYAP